MPNFPVAAAEICRELTAGRTIGRALDLGCATGRATFELARFCDHVTGIDFSARFIRVGHEMQQKGYIRYAIPEEGELVSYHERTLADLGLEDVRDKVEFWQGDAHNLKAQFTDYDLVLACNLIDRLYDPARFLEHITGRINPGGLLVLLSPYTWLEEFTPRDKWLGGLKIDGENVTTLEGLQASPGARLQDGRRAAGRGIRDPGNGAQVPAHRQPDDACGKRCGRLASRLLSAVHGRAPFAEHDVQEMVPGQPPDDGRAPRIQLVDRAFHFLVTGGQVAGFFQVAGRPNPTAADAG